MSNLSRVPGLLLLPLNLFPYYGSAVAIHSCPPSGQTMAGTNHHPCLSPVALLECTNSIRALTQASYMLNSTDEAGSVPRLSTFHSSFLFSLRAGSTLLSIGHQFGIRAFSSRQSGTLAVNCRITSLCFIGLN